ncbi:hypothetical protein F1C58_12115 [Glaciihabitans sp. INWT7]|uniref:hypothetical protein n=1 Tax=Glaciihabitans sp. INWT7 TaxID=2596912 RepID=UPI00162879F7|nr:hypothetical protein [Glaciihabitans sp. INWT7]QNE47571.1 hypothetical protein F1C58_12115 [Glaciihabitans sp. INWT7]
MSGAPQYPGRPNGLSKFEAEQVRDHGPDPKWLEPWAQHVVLFPGVTPEPYGLMHLHGDQSDVSTWGDQDGLSRGLDAMYRSHTQCDDCGGVLYFALDEPRLRAVIELDDEEASE